MAGLAQFLGALGALGAQNLGPVGGPRAMPRPIPSIDPNIGMPGPIGGFGGGTFNMDGTQATPTQGAQNPLAQLFANVGPIAQPDMGGVQEGMQALGSRAPEVRQGGGRFLGISNSGLRDFLGTLGDSLLAANDSPLLYTPRREQQKLGEAMAQFVGADFAELARVAPELAYRIHADQQGGGDPFTLGEGQARYDARGNLIAQGPEGSPDVTVIDGIAYDKRTGEPLFESPYPRIIPGQEGAFFEQPRLGLGRPPQGAAPPSPQAPGNAPAILRQATARGYVLPDEITALRQQLGPNGQAAMEGWMQQNRVRIATRTGTAPDGRKVVQFDDGTVEYAD